tara:strand:+ start:456 stop:605 length:150 start_codon:yes stop_codon:yes gene_type:complete
MPQLTRDSDGSEYFGRHCGRPSLTAESAEFNLLLPHHYFDEHIAGLIKD